jgi:c-di-GMP-binding flagellar brake protein YcgR
MTTAESSPQSPAIPLPILAGSEYDKYMLRNPTEALQLLRQLQAHVTQLTVFCNQGQDMLLTVLLEVTPDRLILDIGADEEINRRVLAADKHYCLGQLERVRIQFLLGRFERIEYQGRPAFRAALPQEMLRLQRREYYRLSTPAARPLKCRLTLPAANGGAKVLEVNVLDISVGGVGIAVPSDELTLEVGQSIPACRIDLPEIGIIEGALCVRQLGISFAGNHTRLRAGCEFVNLPGPQQTLIQRYIIHVERERKARAAGLGV